MLCLACVIVGFMVGWSLGRHLAYRWFAQELKKINDIFRGESR